MRLPFNYWRVTEWGLLSLVSFYIHTKDCQVKMKGGIIQKFRIDCNQPKDRDSSLHKAPFAQTVAILLIGGNALWRGQGPSLHPSLNCFSVIESCRAKSLNEQMFNYITRTTRNSLRCIEVLITKKRSSPAQLWWHVLAPYDASVALHYLLWPWPPMARKGSFTSPVAWLSMELKVVQGRSVQQACFSFENGKRWKCNSELWYMKIGMCAGMRRRGQKLVKQDFIRGTARLKPQMLECNSRWSKGHRGAFALPSSGVQVPTLTNSIRTTLGLVALNNNPLVYEDITFLNSLFYWKWIQSNSSDTGFVVMICSHGL